MYKQICIVFLMVIWINFVTAQATQQKIVFASNHGGNWEIYLSEGMSLPPIRLTEHPADDYEPSLSPDGNYVVFVSARDGGHNLYRLELKTKQILQITEKGPDVQFRDPDWSPDGKKIVASVKFGEDNFDIYVMNADGRNLKKLTNAPGDDTFPHWSPDGKQIAFTSRRNDMTDIYVMDANGNHQTNVSQNPDNFNNLDYYPAWSPDGQQIAYAKSHTIIPTSEVYLMNADGSNIIQLTKTQWEASWPAWSPDGQRIAFVSSLFENGVSRGDIWVINADGTNLRQLTKSKAMEGPLNWSPDGEKIAFSSEGNICVIDPDRDEFKQLTKRHASAQTPAWSPDGGRIAFSSRQEGAPCIYIMDADGENIRRLTNNGGDYWPAWSPNGETIAFISHQGNTAFLYTIDANGRNEKRLFEDAGIRGPLSWSPDGKWFLFGLEFPIQQMMPGQIYRLDADGQNLRAITRGLMGRFEPALSPDGQKIAFISTPPDIRRVVLLRTISADGAQSQTIVELPAEEIRGLTWSPDGTQILVAPGDGYNFVLYLVDVHTHEITKWFTNANSPDWILSSQIFMVHPRGKLLSTWGEIKKEKF